MNCKHVMIVEDDIDIREALTQMLEMEGYDISAASNGQIALDKLTAITCKNETPGLIILDLMMPIMDGITFLKEIEANHKDFQKIPIVVASANLNFSSNLNLAHAVEKICKPLDIDQVYGIVRKHCGEPVHR